MKSKNLSIVVLIILSVSLSAIASDDNKNKNTEEFYYKLKLGWFTLGSGKVKIEYNSMNISGDKYHKVFAHATTLGLGNWLSNLDDKYTSVLHSKTSKSFHSYKNVKAGDSKLELWNNYDYDSMKVRVKGKDYRKEDPEVSWTVDMNDETFDVLGTYMFFRTHDWDGMNPGDTVMIYTHYEKRLYKAGMHYQGIEKLNLNGQKIKAHKMHLLLPDQKKLKKDRPVVIWISADEDRLPLKIYSKLFIGSARCELHTINNEEPAFTNQP